MMSLIGLSEDRAKEQAVALGYKVNIIYNNSDKQTNKDCKLVTNAVVDGDTCYLTVSDFLLNVEE